MFVVVSHTPRLFGAQITLAVARAISGPKTGGAAGQPHSNTPHYGYSRQDSIPYLAI